MKSTFGKLEETFCITDRQLYSRDVRCYWRKIVILILSITYGFANGLLFISIYPYTSMSEPVIHFEYLQLDLL